MHSAIKHLEFLKAECGEQMRPSKERAEARGPEVLWKQNNQKRAKSLFWVEAGGDISALYRLLSPGGWAILIGKEAPERTTFQYNYKRKD